MSKIKFGTDGWRAIMGREYTVANVRRVSEGLALYMKKHSMQSVVIGHDTRQGGAMFCKEAASVLASRQIKVYLFPFFVTTPMISTAVVAMKRDMGVVITASHNPPEYNGFKIKESYGGPARDQVLEAIEALIPEKDIAPAFTFDQAVEKGLIIEADLEAIYLERIEKTFDLPGLQELSRGMAYDSMYGAGSRIAKKLFPHAVHLHDEPNPGFRGIPPEPIGKNLTALCQRINEDENLHFGLANDGDADRIGLVDEKGNFVDAHHIMLLVLYYLVEIKKQKGPVILSAATSEKVGHLAKSYGLEHEFTKIGFKHITPRFIDRQAIMGGEEAGGVAVAGHIPERDGIWAALIVMELMQHSGQSLGQLIQMIYEKVGPFVYDRMDLHLDERQKTAIVRKCQEDAFTHIADYPVRERILVDGYKYYLGEACWLMIRPSGTEPVLRIYAQAQTGRELHTLLKKSKAFLSGIKE